MKKEEFYNLSTYNAACKSGAYKGERLVLYTENERYKKAIRTRLENGTELRAKNH